MFLIHGSILLDGSNISLYISPVPMSTMLFACVVSQLPVCADLCVCVCLCVSCCPVKINTI